MKWKALVAAVMTAGWCAAAQQAAVSPYEIDRRAAVEMNQIAGHVQSPEDARRLVDMIADEFKDYLPPGRAQRRICERVATAEYETATDREKRIPEQRIADAWNHYAAEIGAPGEWMVTVAEIHYLRDALYTSSRIFWRGGNESIWTMPGIYATGADGRLDEGSRAVETLMVVWDLAANHEDLPGVREAVRKGVLLSDVMRQQAEKHVPEKRVLVEQITGNNPVEDAEGRYVREHGVKGLRRAVEAMIEELVAR